MEERTFEDLYQHYHARLCRRLHTFLGDWEEAEDVAQDVWVKFLDRGPRDGNSTGWLSRVAENTAIDRLRHRAVVARHRAEKTIDDLAETLPTPEPSPQEVIDLSERTNRALTSLRPAYRQALILHHVYGLPIARISKITGDSAFAIRTRLCRGRKAFRASFLVQQKR